ncbi:ribosome-associated translation inhibitor RaiA [Mucilaginibacter sp. Bleaf8]|uniref:ribosome hibernation-promoting factor, HPF/YfiA family n=1 Tax=Mucilaginibacter sp. Bleaf8 TaxID=2834430 RepID=UPI001BCF469B|nr:ribosome-associated translation inhibitor RaiA [Mucilaginibacter sp. Bleaf8]MBS7566438.1 ribosome-associated translation inhibitor RaiA [Mucilaginibacter sp. Bleaf8]
MKITVQAVHFSADKKLLDFIQKKTNKLELFSDKIVSGEVFLKLENTEDAANKITEIRLNIPGNQLFARHQCKSFEEGTDLAIESLRKQIQKHKEKKAAQEEASVKPSTLLVDEDEF